MIKTQTLVLFLGVVGMGWCDAQEFSLSPITRTKAAGWVSVDGGWVQNADLLKVRFRPSATFTGDLPLLAGFFDSEGRVLQKIDEVPQLVARGSEFQSLPETLEPGRSYEVFFPIPPSLEKGASKWNAFVVKIGHGDTAVGAIYPTNKGEWNAFDFSKSKSIASSDASESDNPAVVPIIRQVIRYKNPMNGLIEGEWMTGLTTLKARVRLDSGAEHGNFFVKAYFFDSKGNRVFDYQAPPEVEIRRGTKYVTLPPMWENQTDYEIHFPISPTLERGNTKWKTAVIVFGNKSTAVAATYPGGSVDFSDFDFPELAMVQKEKDSPEE